MSVCYAVAMTTERCLRVTRHTVNDEVQRLAVYVARMERRYECSSAFAELAVASGNLKETAEISRWLTNYRVLTRLSAGSGVGAETGSHTPATK